MNGVVEEQRDPSRPATGPRSEIESKSVWGLLGHVAANRLYQQIAMLTILVLTARWLGPDGRGALAAAMAWMQLGGTAANLSLGRIAFQQDAANRGGWSAALIATLIASCAISFSGLFFILAAAGALTEGGIFGDLPIPMLALAALAAPLFVWEDYAFYLFASRLSLPRNYTIISIGRTVSLAMVVFLVAVFQLGSLGAMLAILIGQATSSVWTFAIVRNDMRGSFRVDVPLMRDFFFKSAKLHPQTLAIALFGASDVVLLHAFRNDAEVGHYQAAWLLMALPVFASTAVGNVLYQLIAERGADGAWRQQVKLMGLALAAAVAVSVVTSIAAPLVVPLAFGDAFAPSANILIALLPFGFAQILSNLMAPQWVARGWFALSSFVIVGIALISVSLNVILIPAYGPWGAVFTSWVSATAWIGLNAALAIWIESKCRRDAMGLHGAQT